VEPVKHDSEVRAALGAPPGWRWNRASSVAWMGFLCEQAFSGALAFVYFGFLLQGKKTALSMNESS